MEIDNRKLIQSLVRGDVRDAMPNQSAHQPESNLSAQAPQFLLTRGGFTPQTKSENSVSKRGPQQACCWIAGVGNKREQLVSIVVPASRSSKWIPGWLPYLERSTWDVGPG
jgi:hypothetical protein